MTISVIDNFKGLYTETDDYTNPGATDILNVDIEMDGNLCKAEGFTLTDTSKLISAVITTQPATAIGSNLLTPASQTIATSVSERIFIGNTSTSGSHIFEFNVTSITGDFVIFGIHGVSQIITATGTHFLDVGSYGTGDVIAVNGYTDGSVTFNKVYLGENSYNVKYRFAFDNASSILTTDQLLITPNYVEDTLVGASNKVMKVSASAASYVDTSTTTGSYTLESATASIFIGMKNLKGLLGTSAVMSSAKIEDYGDYYDDDTDNVYKFMGQTTDNKSYLVYSDKDVIDWQYYEATTASACTDFGTTYEADFVKHEDKILFVKNESKVIASNTGGTFCFDTASSSIALYGVENNPTGKTIETFKERICVGNISKQESTPVGGESWVQVSKFLPEEEDTTSTIAASGCSVGTRTLLTFTASHGYAVGDFVYVDGISASAGTDKLNGLFWKVTETDTTTVYLESDTTGLGVPVDGAVTLRGNTWSDNSVIYDDTSLGAGVFRCDDNENDGVIKLKKSFGALFILRERNPFIFTGAIESGGKSLAKQLNVPYGTLAKSVAMSANGFFFVSDYGITNVRGIVIQDNANQFDNITSTLITELIKTKYDDINDKTNIKLSFNNRYLWVQDNVEKTTLVFDTAINQWTVYYGRLGSYFFNVENELYSSYKYYIFKHYDGWQTFNERSLSYDNQNSTYKTKIFDFDTDKQKMYKYIKVLLQGVASSDEQVLVSFNLKYNGKTATARILQYDIKTSGTSTWLSLGSSGDTWADLGSASESWEDLSDNDVFEMLEKLFARLGTSPYLQIEITHNSNSAFKLSKVTINYDIINIETLRET